MLNSPQIVTINTVANTLNMIESEKTSSIYSNSEATLALRVSHQPTKSRIRRMARIDSTIIAADPLTAENSSQKAGVYLVIDEPKYGFSDTDLLNLTKGLIAWLSDANISAVLASRH